MHPLTHSRLRRPFRRGFAALSLTLLGLGLFAPLTQALILQAEDELVFDEYVTEDLYLAGGEATIQEDVDGDVFVTGGEVTLNGDVQGDLFVIGGTVLLNGNVGDDVRVIGADLSVNGNVNGDLLMVGATVDVNQGTTILGDVVLVSGTAKLYGTVNRSVRGILSKLVIGGQVNGDVDVRVTEQLVLLRSASIGGNVRYFAPNTIEDHGGTIGGEVSFNEINSSTDRVKEGFRGMLSKGQWIGALWSYLSLLLIGGIFVALFPHFFEHTSTKIQEKALKSFGVGFLVFVLGGVFAVFATFTVIGVQLAFIVMALLFILGELGRVAAGYWLGSLIHFKHKRKRSGKTLTYLKRFGPLVVGLFILKLLGLVPYLGWTLGFVFFLMGAGAIMMTVREHYHRLLKERKV